MTAAPKILRDDLPIVDVQFSLVPASDRFIPIILDAVSDISGIEGLSVATDAVSSHLSGRADIVFGAIADVFRKAALSGAHIVLPFHAAVSPGAGHPAARTGSTPADWFFPPAASSVAAATQFALSQTDGTSGSEAHGDTADFLQWLGLSVRPKALVARVDGDAASIFAAYAAILAWRSDVAGTAVLTGTAVANIPNAEAFA